MNKGDHIEQAYFSAALEDGGTFSTDYRSVYGQPDVIPAKSHAEAVHRLIARFVSGTAAPETGAELVSTLLRSYTDEWLETGIDHEGRESPFARKLTNTQTALTAVRRYESRSGQIVDWDDGLKRLPVRLIDRLRVTVPGEKTAAPVPLLPAVQDVWTPPIVASLYPSSSLAETVRPASAAPDWLKKHWNERPTRKQTTEKQVTAEHPNMPRDVASAALHRANVLFHAFMKAPWRYRLGKCKRCQIYFVLKVNPSKTPYVRGMHCPDCKSPASAGASAKTRRADREKQLLGLAADVWSSWRPAPQFGERNHWVATQVCKLLSEKKAIQRNWVTRHEREIAAEVKKRRGKTR